MIKSGGEQHMMFEKDKEIYSDLIQYMESHGYSQDHIARIKTEINWLIRNQQSEEIQSYGEACRIRESHTESVRMHKCYRTVYAILEDYDLHGIFPDERDRREPSWHSSGSSYSQLNPFYKEIIDTYGKYGRKRGLKESTIHNVSFSCSSFFLTMQRLGKNTLDDISEEDVMSFFFRGNGNESLSGGYKDTISSVLKADLGIHTDSARRVLAYFPAIRQRRKNIQYLKPDEADAIHDALSSSGSGLSLRDRAIGLLLFFTGIRGCDIVHMKFTDIDWKKDEIRLIQQKTGSSLTLPLTATVGNAIYDYITMGRPCSTDTHVFLSMAKTHSPLSEGSIGKIASKIYEAASVRQNSGDRRGTHLFRHHVASTLAGNGIAQPVISETLGHTAHASLDCYLSADMAHLRECARSVECFPVGEEVFRI